MLVVVVRHWASRHGAVIMMNDEYDQDDGGDDDDEYDDDAYDDIIYEEVKYMLVWYLVAITEKKLFVMKLCLELLIV